MKRSIRYATTSDQANLAWAEIGHGMPLVRAATWMTHLQYDLESPVWAYWIRFFGEHFRFIRHDERGCGLSDTPVEGMTLPRWMDDLESVVDAADIDRPCVLLGISHACGTPARWRPR